MNLELEGDTALAARFEKTPKNVGRALAGGMVKVGLGLRAHLTNEHLSGQDLDVRTGQGRRSAFYRVETGNEQDIAVVVGNDLRKAKYMRAHDKGAVLVPKSAGSLTIPIGAAATSKGVARFSARDVIGSPGSFGYVGTFTKHGVIFGKKGNKEKAVPLFILAKRVRLRALGFLARTLQEKRDWAQRAISDAVGQGLRSE